MSEQTVRSISLEILLRMEKSQGFSHILIDEAIRSNYLSKKDEGLLTEIVYGTMDKIMTLDYYLEPFLDQKKIQDWVRMLLRMSVYQMEYLDKVPTYAVINEAVNIAKQKGHKGIASVVNGVLRNIDRKGVPSTIHINDDVKRISIQTSHPLWLVQRWVKQYGFTEMEKMCKANGKNKNIVVRVQLQKISREEAMDELINEGFSLRPSELSRAGIIILEGNIFPTHLFSEGYLTIQDESSMLVGEMLNAKEGMKVLDTCSAPGGKVTHIAEEMNNKGSIFAHDIHKKKLKKVNEKAKSLNLSIIDVSALDARILREHYKEESFDRIVVDAPCSGLGVIRSKPDVKYNKKESDIERLHTIQLDILNEVAPLLKMDGQLIYSTCTVDKVENELVVKQFLSKNKSYQVDETFFEELPDILKQCQKRSEVGLQLLPQDLGTDGFFLTRLNRR